MPDYVADTHALIWYLEDSPRLGESAQKIFDACDRGETLIFVPTIVLVEMLYLQEKGRIPSDLVSQFREALHHGESGLALADLTEEVAVALAKVPRTAVPELADRIIAATALQMGLALISRDHKIQVSGTPTVW